MSSDVCTGPSPSMLALARHRFVASPVEWCDPSWLVAVLNGPTGEGIRVPRSRPARAYLNACLLARYAPSCCDEKILRGDQGIGLAVLPRDWHSVLLKALGLHAMGLAPEAVESDRERLAGVFRALDSLDAWSAPSAPIDGGLLAPAATEEAALAIGGQVLMNHLAGLPKPIRTRWCLRLPQEIASGTLPLANRPEPQALDALAQRLREPDAWGGLPCW